MKRKKLLLNISLLLFSAILLFLLASYGNMFLNNKNVKNISQNTQTIFFYRDDCKKCRIEYPLEYLKKEINSINGKKTIFINTNSVQNRHWVEKFEIKTVPTKLEIQGSK